MIFLLSSLALAQQNLGFEEVRPNGSLRYWWSGTADADVAHEGARSLRLDGSRRQPVVAAQGRWLVDWTSPTVTLVGQVRHGARSAGLWLDGDERVELKVKPTDAWTEVAVTLALTPGDHRIHFGAIVRGEGPAWFDGLRVLDAEGRDHGLPEVRLFDEERPLDPVPGVAEAEAAWVRANARSLDDPDVLRPLLADRRIVQLGESSHGASEYNRVRLDLVRHLHEALGFDVLAFESPVFDCEQASGTPRERLEQCTWVVWHTQEVLELFEYLDAQERAGTPLRLTGFDVQVWEARERERFLPFVASQVAVSPQELEAIGSLWEEVRGRKRARHIERSLAVAEAVADRMPATEGGQLAAAALRGRRWVARARAGGGGGALRDEGMAHMIRWLAEERYPTERIIVWAANFHVRHDGAEDGPQSHGHYVKQWFGDQVYSIGLYARRGAMALNNRDPVAVRPLHPRSWEAVMSHAGHRLAFVDVEGASGPGTAWMDEPRPTWDWGFLREHLTLRRQFDGLLLIDTVSPPAYLD